MILYSIKGFDKIKQDELLNVSNPIRVIMNARKYFNDPDIKVYLSTRKKSKYAIYNPEKNKYIHFGHMDFEDYTHSLNETKRTNYLNRSSNIKGDWINDKYSPNNLSINLLWQ